jgi:hypothetical protein
MTKRLFHDGQIVICINDDFSWARKAFKDHNLSFPTFGNRYVVRGYVCGGRAPALVVQEIINPQVRYNDGVTREAGFWDVRFVGAPPPEHALEKMDEEINA